MCSTPNTVLAIPLLKNLRPGHPSKKLVTRGLQENSWKALVVAPQGWRAGAGWARGYAQVKVRGLTSPSLGLRRELPLVWPWSLHPLRLGSPQARAAWLITHSDTTSYGVLRQCADEKQRINLLFKEWHKQCKSRRYCEVEQGPKNW